MTEIVSGTATQHEPTPVAPELQFAVLCDGVAQDAASRKFALVGLFDELLQPSILPQFFLVCKWIKGMGSFTQAVEILKPDLSPLGPPLVPQDFQLVSKTQGANVVTGFINFNFPEAGVHWVQIKLDGELVLAFPLPVHRPRD